MGYGDVIRSLRLEKAWSQEELGAIAGISARTVQRLEQGQRPSLETLKALAAAFDVPVARLAPADLSSEEPAMIAETAQPAHDRPGLWRHVAIYAAVIGALAALNLIRNPEHLWVIYPALGWGAVLVLKAWRRRRA